MTTATKRAERVESLAQLRKWLKPGSTVYTVLRHVSSSGMSRRIDLYVIRHNRPIYLTGYVGKVLDYRRSKDGGLVVGGCGMDMGYHLVHSLGMALWPHGTRKPHGTRNGSPDNDGGYALNHDWL